MPVVTARRGLAMTAVVIALVLVPAYPAQAHHAEVRAKTSCTGQVTVTATAWPGHADKPNTAVNEKTLSRTNPKIAISYSIDRGQSFSPLPQKSEYAFTAANRYTFTATFQLPNHPLAATVVVSARAAAPWADGGVAASGSKQQTSALLTIPRCPPTPTPSTLASAAPPSRAPTGRTSTAAAVSSGDPIPAGVLLTGGGAAVVLAAAGWWALRQLSAYPDSRSKTRRRRTRG